jgi:DNA-binding SARP family transcriptional activator
MMGDDATLAATLSRSPVLVCLLGRFRVLKTGRQVRLKPGGKAEVLLAHLAAQPDEGVERDRLLDLLWPRSELSLATQSLNTLVHSIHLALRDATAGRPPILYDGGRYRLNAEDGVAVDAVHFEEAADEGDRLDRCGDLAGAIRRYGDALGMYAGDLVVGSDVRHALNRERLRARYLSIQARLSDHRFSQSDYAEALSRALDLLAHDPCREDAHRMAMRCHNRLGQRAQALRQYRLCCEILDREFGAVPEGATTQLFELLRVDPVRA